MSEVEKLNAEDAALLASIERAFSQLETGDVHVTTGAEIARRTAGRPKGSRAAVRKEAITLRIAPDALARWRATGKGWQTRMAQVLAVNAPG
ncbi:MAG: BrnA antitoxin family protein [Rhodocyclaceae bacterium]|nr:BrnA antitoxin family protein [Rhodocyclaceae bacterium]